MKSRSRVFTAAAAVLSVIILVILVLSADHLISGSYRKESDEIRQEDYGEDQSSLTVARESAVFDGNGIFDPMEGIRAIDCNGEDITYKVAVAYLTQKDIQKKMIRYTVYNSAGEKLAAECELELKGYEGPDIECDTVDRISFADLDDIAGILANDGKLHGDDGFGNDVTEGIACSYELDTEEGFAVITLSLQNTFGDVKIVKFEAAVEDMPQNGAD